MSIFAPVADPISEWQPYARHFMHTHGLTDPTLFHGPTFWRWIDAQWQVYAAEIGVTRDRVRLPQHRDGFAPWLAKRCGCGESS